MKFNSICEDHLYRKAYAKGKRFVTPALAVYVLPDYRANVLMKAHPRKLKVNRIGLTVTKKIGGAVTRSRVRRILREAYRQTDRETPLRRGFLIVLCAREKTKKKKSTDLARELSFAMRKLDMIAK